jgi:DnaJ like chaperone protein
MANFVKWLGAGLGFTLGGPIGSILGFAVGSFIDGFSKEDLQLAKSYGAGNSNVQSGDFEVSLLLLSSIVIKADGKIDERELLFVREHFKRMYGEERATNAYKLFNIFIKSNQISTPQICTQIRQNLTHASRLQLVHFLFGIANADGAVLEVEVNAIKTIAGYLYVNLHDFESIKAMFYNNSDSTYRILEIEKTASNDEVKLAYRKMAKKYHPDKLQHLGEEHIKGAEEKFKQVSMAYEQIQKERGM